MLTLTVRSARKNKMFRDLSEAAGTLLVDTGRAWRYDICESAGYEGMADQLDWRPWHTLWFMTWELLNPGCEPKLENGEVIPENPIAMFIYSATEVFFEDHKNGLFPPEDEHRFVQYLAGVGGKTTAGWFIETDDNKHLIRDRLAFEKIRKVGMIKSHIDRVLSAKGKHLLDAPSARLLQDLHGGGAK